MDGKKWNWTLILCVVLLGVNLWQGKRLSELERDIWNAQNSVMNNISRMDQRLSSLYAELESADDLVRDWEYHTSVDMEKRRLNADITVNLKEWNEDTAVDVVWENLYGESLEGTVRLTGTPAGSFRGTLGLPGLERLNEISVAAVITNGGTQRRENLGSLGDVAGLLPLQCSGWGLGGPMYSAKEGTFTVSGCEAELYGQSQKVPVIKDPIFRLARNGETVAEQAAEQEDRLDSYTCGELSAGCRPGDKLCLTFLCKDENGLSYEFYLYGWTVDENGFRDEYASYGEYPKLTWK